MRNFLALIIFGICLTVLSGYLLVTISPFNENLDVFIINEGVETEDSLRRVLVDELNSGTIVKILDVNNVIVVTSMVLLCLAVWLFVVQLIINWTLRRGRSTTIYIEAIRRAALTALTLAALIYYRLFALDIYLYLSTILLVLILEVLVTRATNQVRIAVEKAKSEDNQSNTQEPTPLKNKNGAVTIDE